MNFTATVNRFLFLGALFSLVLVTSCKKDSEPDRDKFLGVYSVVETCGSGTDSYEITVIESGSGENAVIIGNLYDAGASVSATVSGSSLTIASQDISGITVSGSGSISGNVLTINFTVSASGQGSDNCNAICTRK